jgi:hypothetical protein
VLNHVGMEEAFDCFFRGQLVGFLFLGGHNHEI